MVRNLEQYIFLSIYQYFISYIHLLLALFMHLLLVQGKGYVATIYLHFLKFYKDQYSKLRHHPAETTQRISICLSTCNICL